MLSQKNMKSGRVFIHLFIYCGREPYTTFASKRWRGWGGWERKQQRERNSWKLEKGWNQELHVEGSQLRDSCPQRIKEKMKADAGKSVGLVAEVPIWWSLCFSVERETRSSAENACGEGDVLGDTKKVRKSIWSVKRPAKWKKMVRP